MSSPDLATIHRRAFLSGLALSMLAVPFAAEAQPQTGKVWRIGVMMSLYPPDADAPQALRQGLRTLGYVEGQNLVIDWRYVQGRDDRLPTLAAELVRLSVDLIVTDITLATVGSAPGDQPRAVSELR